MPAGDLEGCSASAPGGGPRSGHGLVVGLDTGGTANNVTVLDTAGHFLIDRMVESPSRVAEGPPAALHALRASFDGALSLVGADPADVLAVGLATPGPASATGVLSSEGATNFSEPGWHGFDIRGALEERLGLQVVYNNDGNAAALHAHRAHFGDAGEQHSSVSAIVGTGLGGGLIEAGRVVRGGAGMAGELGHVHIPLGGLLESDQPEPRCNCGFVGDAESIASLTGIERNLLPYWLTRYPDHPLGDAPSPKVAARAVRGLGEQGDPLALRIFEQQAMAIGRLFTICSNVSDPSAYFLGGGVVEAEPHFRDWFVDRVRHHTALRAEQCGVAFGLVPDRDMAGARGAALDALSVVRTGRRLS